MPVTLNEEQRLFAISCGGGVSCLGFDVCESRSNLYHGWLLGRGVYIGLLPDTAEKGTLEAYERYMKLIKLIREYCQTRGVQCDVSLIPELSPYEGKRVEVVDCHGEKRRFIVGKSMGDIPIHLEIARRDSSGGPAACGNPYKSIELVG